MSNTAEVTPYDDDLSSDDNYYYPSQSQASADTVGTPSSLATALAEILRIATQETPADATAVARQQDRRQQDRLSRIRLHGGNPEYLLNAAAQMGFRPLSPVSAAPNLSRPVELINPQGARIALQAANGRLGLVGTVQPQLLRDIVGAASLESARRHMETLGGTKVTVRRLANGEVELCASEGVRSDGAAQVTARIDRSGVARVDIESIRGPRCKQVLDSLARAIGGKTRDKRFKPSYYQKPAKPGEPTRLKPRG